MATLGKALPQTQTTVLPVGLLAGKTTALKFRDEILLALDTLRKNSLRSALTILGIVIGITTVITVTAVINGLNDNVLGGIRELGSDTIIAYRFPWASLSRPPSDCSCPCPSCKIPTVDVNPNSCARRATFNASSGSFTSLPSTELMFT